MKSIMLIDDDPVFVRLARNRLAEEGYCVDCNLGAFGALTAVRRKHYDVILLDVLMPGIPGTRLLEYLRSSAGQGSRLILISTLSARELEQATQLHGAHGYFCKDWGFDRLVFLVKASAGASSASSGPEPRPDTWEG